MARCKTFYVKVQSVSRLVFFSSVLSLFFKLSAWIFKLSSPPEEAKTISPDLLKF